MIQQHTTQQFTPIIISLSLATTDQSEVVEIYLKQSSQYCQPEPNQIDRHVELTSDSDVTLSSFRELVGNTVSNLSQPSEDSHCAVINPASSNIGKIDNSIPNIIWLNKIDQPFGIEQWRDLLLQTQSTINNQRLIVAILHADTLSQATQNAMLKSLEEPPPHVQFILATNRPTSLLPTIQSRCQLVRVVNSNQTQPTVGQNSVQFSINRSTGNKSVTSQPNTPTDQPSLIAALDLIKTVRSGSTSSALIASDQFKERDQAKSWIIQVLDWSQQRLSKSGRQKSLTNQKSENTQSTSELEQVIDLDWPTWVGALLIAHQQLEQNLHVKLVMDQLFLTLVD